MNTIKNVEKLGRQAWLAGLGAYGTGWKYAVEKFDKTYAQTNILVNDLMTEGEKIEGELQQKFKAKELLESKMVALKSKLGLNDDSEAERLEELTAKVDNLTAAVVKLVESRLAEKTAKTPKSSVKKAATSKVKS